MDAFTYESEVMTMRVIDTVTGLTKLSYINNSITF